MITAAYTICKNEQNRITDWFKYASMFDYMVVLDTGSTDETWNLLKAKAAVDSRLILEQRIFSPFDFSKARNYNLSMVPDEVEWCLSPDMDEWFSINVLEEIDRTVKQNPDVTNITTTRLDIYSKDVFVGPPYNIPTNKIHRRHHYHWVAPIYEHLWPNDLANQKEVYNDKIFLIHNQDTTKPRSTLYLDMMKTRYDEDQTDCWNNWYLLNHYYREKKLHEYVDVALNFLKYSKNYDTIYDSVYEDIRNLYLSRIKNDLIMFEERMEEVLYHDTGI